jgi:hypothetical protein
MKQIQSGNNTMVGLIMVAPNGENLDDFMRLDASFLVTVSISPQPLKPYAVEVINITDEDNVINRYYKVDPNKNNTVTVNININLWA